MNHESYPPGYTTGLLSEVNTIGLVGASANPSRPSHRVMSFLLARGYKVVPINPGLVGQQLLGQTVYANLSEVPIALDMIDIFRSSDAVPALVDEALSLPSLPRVIWMQLGVRDDASAAKSETAGMAVVMNRCPAIELSH